jgi:hypothetical protein
VLDAARQRSELVVTGEAQFSWPFLVPPAGLEPARFGLKGAYSQANCRSYGKVVQLSAVLRDQNCSVRDISRDTSGPAKHGATRR